MKLEERRSGDVIFDEGNVPKVDVDVDGSNMFDGDGSLEYDGVDGSSSQGDGGDGSSGQDLRRSSRQREKPFRLTYDEKGKQIVGGTHFALLTSFCGSSFVDDGLGKDGCLHGKEVINGSGKDVLLNGFDVQEEDQVVDLKVLHQHQVDLGNLEQAKGIKVESKGQSTKVLFFAG